jgi:ubiquinone/menaquinone biosynthesis C-methylase UbiE
MLPQIGRRDAEFFYAGARWMAETVKNECRLGPEGSVLDLGCGVGRLAIGLLDYLAPTGRYEGLDIDAASIRWAQRHVQGKHPGIRFQVADVRNEQYNPRGRIAPERHRLPFDDRAFDVAFLHSVFTHMVPTQVERYLGELRRVVRPGGYTHISYYLLNPEAHRLAGEGKAALEFPFDFGGYRSISRETPEYSVALEESLIREMYARHGLEIDEIAFGSWCGRAGARGYQDMIIARPRP